MDFYHTIEVEATNFCNAKCVFCANSSLERKKGYISVSDFEKFMYRMGNRIDRNLFSNLNIKGYPMINFCGLGDPLLHPNLVELVRCAKNAGFYTQVVSNGICFDSKKAMALCESGLDKICLSLHSLNPRHYKDITGVELHLFIDDVTEAIKISQMNGAEVNIWRIHHPLDENRDGIDDEKLYGEFLKRNGLEDIVIFGPSEPWYRDGVVPNSRCEQVDDVPLWCNKIIFTDYIDWQGNAVLCCNDYNRETINLGNVFAKGFSYDVYLRKKIEILTNNNKPFICKKCRRWPDTEVLSIIETAGIEKGIFTKQLISNLNKISKGEVNYEQD